MRRCGSRRAVLTILFSQLLHPCILGIRECKELHFSHVRCRGLFPEVGVVACSSHCEREWTGKEEGGWEKARNNGTIYRCPFTCWVSKPLEITESAWNGCPNLIPYSPPSPTHGPCTYSWGRRTAVYLRLRYNHCQNDEQTYETTYEATQHQNDTACESDSCLPSEEEGAAMHCGGALRTHDRCGYGRCSRPPRTR